MTDERREFFDRELAPLLDSERLLIEKADEALQNEEINEAELFLKGALLVNPANENAREKLKGVRRDRLRRLAFQFIQRFYPQELKLFDLSWRIFFDFSPDDFKQEAVSGTLGIVGRTEYPDVVTPKVIVLLSAVDREKAGSAEDEEIREIISVVGRKIGCSQKLTHQVLRFVLSSETQVVIRRT